MPSKEKRRYVSVKVDTFLRDKFALGGRLRRSRESCGDNIWRCSKFITFAVVFLASLCQTLAPWMLSCLEALAVLLIYFLGTHKPLLIGLPSKQFSYSYTHSLEDIVILSNMRALWLSLAYGLGSSARNFHRPYLISSYLLGAVVFPYALVKAILFKYERRSSIVFLLFSITALFSWFHIFAARRIVDRAKKRYQMGLLNFWDENEETWTLMGPDTAADAPKCSSDSGTDLDQDVPVDCLADDDSKFVKVNNITVHYKEVAPRQAAADGDEGIGILLVHGFGGGVFAWRHLMEPLAMQCRCRVVAYDQPGFGLTSRPKEPQEGIDVYKVSSQAELLLRFATAIGLQKVLLVGHADGCLITLLAAAATKSLVRLPAAPLASSHAAINSSISSGLMPHQSSSMGTAAPATLGDIGDPTSTGRGYFSSRVMDNDGALPLLRGDLEQGLPTIAEVSLQPEGIEIAGTEQLQVLGVAFLHPNLSGHVGASGFTRLLGKSRLGRSILRPLLRTEIGEVANRRAWYNSDKLTPEVLELYKAPLRVEGWDHALLEVSRQRQDLSSSDLSPYITACSGTPSIIITGEHDRIVPPSKAEAIAQSLSGSQLTVIANCGHLSHEETPGALIPLLVGFCHQFLFQAS